MATMALLKRETNIQDNRQPEMLRESIPLIILATLSVIGRILSRRCRKASLGADDYFIMGALISTWGHFTLLVTDTFLGVGKHTVTQPRVDKTRVLKVVFAGSIIYATSITLIKISILLFYQRVFATRTFFLVTRIIGVVVVAWCVVVIIIQVFSCNPIHGFWDSSIRSTCVNPAHFYIAVAVPNILTDIIILCLPVRMVWRLQTSMVQKIALSLTFMTGAFVIVASIYRILLLHQANISDPLWSYTYVVIWTSIEPCVGVTCACLPTLRPLLREILLKGESVGKIFDSLTNRTRLDQGIQLDSSSKKAGEIKPSHHTRWIDENPRLQPQGYLSGDTTVTSVVGGTDSERDDTQFAGINVRHDVHIEQSQFC